MKTISIAMSQEEKDKLFEILEENNMTVDEAVDGFLRWLIRDTKAALAWIGIDINELKRLRINMITQQEQCEHIDDDDFFLRYGNSVAILWNIFHGVPTVWSGKKMIYFRFKRLFFLILTVFLMTRGTNMPKV